MGSNGMCLLSASAASRSSASPTADLVPCRGLPALCRGELDVDVHLPAIGDAPDAVANLRLEALPVAGDLDREVEAPAVDGAHLDRERAAGEGGRGAAISVMLLMPSPQDPCDLLDVLVPAAAQVDDDDLARGQRAGALHRVDEGMGALERGDDPLQARAELECLEHLVVGGIGVLDAAEVAVVGVLRADGGVVQARGHRMGELDLAVGVLQDERLAALKGRRACPRRTGRRARPCGCRGRPPRRRSCGPPVSSRNSKKSPIALLPPPTHATSSSGRRPSRARICSLASTPITRWKSLTIAG